MQGPIVTPAPLVTTHAVAFHDLFANRCQFQHVQQYLTGLLVLPNKRLANSARWVVDSADKTNLSRFFSEAPGQEAEVTARRITDVLTQTAAHRRSAAASALVVDDTLGEHVGRLFEDVDRHDTHSDASYPLAHHPVTSHDVSGAVRVPVALRLSRRSEEVTRWAEVVHKHVPDQLTPTTQKERAKLHRVVDPVLLDAPDVQPLHAPFHTTIDLAMEVVRQAGDRQVPFRVVRFDSRYGAAERGSVLAEGHKAWVSMLTRNLEPTSFVLRDAAGAPIPFAGPHIKGEDLVPHIPARADRAVTVGEQTSWGCSLPVRLPRLGNVRVGSSCSPAALTGTYVVLVSSGLDWRAGTIIAPSVLRWPVERL